LGFGKLSLLRQQVTNFLVTMVMHHNGCKRLPELQAEANPAADHPNQHRKCSKNLRFYRKKLSGRFRDNAKTDIVSQ